MSVHRACVMLAVLAGGTACAPSIRSARFIEAPAAPPQHEIRLYSTRTPACSYEELGLIVATPSSGFTSLQSMLDGMKKRAREMGGDAIVGLSTGRNVESSGIGELQSTSTSTVLSGTVVRFADPACSA